MQENEKDTIAFREKQLLEEFAGMEDEFDRYTYLMLLGSRLTPIAPGERTPERLFSGCMSKVWMIMEEKEGRLKLALDSDTLIVRGILFLIVTLFDGRTLQEAASCHITVLERLHLDSVFGDARKTGMGSLVKRIREFAGKGEKE